MKMVIVETRDVKCKVANPSFDSAVEIAEEVRINVSQLISLLQLLGKQF